MLDASALLDPLGDIDTSMFPADASADLTARVAAYLARGYAAVGATGLVLTDDITDQAATQYAYALAFTAVAARLSSQPASSSLTGLGIETISSTQVRFFIERARAATMRYDALLATPADSAATSLFAVSHSSAIRYGW